jgi:hypothetical protein
VIALGFFPEPAHPDFDRELMNKLQAHPDLKHLESAMDYDTRPIGDRGALGFGPTIRAVRRRYERRAQTGDENKQTPGFHEIFLNSASL